MSTARPLAASPSGAARTSWPASWLGELSMRWPLLHPLAVMLGAGAYVWSPLEPTWGLLVAVTMAAGLGLVATRRAAGTLGRAVAMACACFMLGAVAGKVRVALVASPMLEREIGPVRVEGVVAEIDASDTSRRIRIEVRAIEGLKPDETPRFVRISHRAEIVVGPGRGVSCLAILSPPPKPVVPGDYEFHRDAWFRQLGGVGFATGACRPLAQPPAENAWQAVERWIGAARRGIAEHAYESAGPKGGGFTAAMLVGDRSFLTPEESDALRDSGLAHLLSISGVHMVLAGGIFFFIIRFTWPLIEPLALRVPAVKAAAAGALIAVTLYFAISGASVATQRAYVMAMIAFGAKLLDRPAISLRSLAVALVVVVLLQPESVATPGFQMSFAASAALVALYEIWPKIDKPEGVGWIGKVGGWVVGAAATSIAASLATMPFALHHFDRTAVLSVIANMVSTPVVSLWTTPAAAVAVLAAPFGAEEPFLWLMGQSLEVVMNIARWASVYEPPLDMPRLPGLGLGLAATGIVLFCALRGPARLVALVPVAGALALWVTAPRTAALVAGDGTVFVRAEQGWVELTDWRGENGLDPMTVRGLKEKAACAGRGAACEVAGRLGGWRVEPVVKAWERAPVAEASGDAAGAALTGPAVDLAPGRAATGEVEQPGRRRVVLPDAASTLVRNRTGAVKAVKQKVGPCPPKARLVFVAEGGGEAGFDPCAIGAAGGAVIEVRDGRASVRFGGSDRARPWG